MHRLNLFILLLFLAGPLYSQKDRIKFNKISLEEGLSQSSITCIAQDSKGFMWFGTLDGLNKYDGYHVKIFRSNLEDPHSIPDNSINTIYETNDESLWIGTMSKGVAVYDPVQERFYSIQHDPKDRSSLCNNNVKCIVEDKNGTLWLGTEHGLARLTPDNRDKQVFINYYHNPKDLGSLVSDNINDIELDYSGNLWLATDKGLVKFNISSNSFTHYPHHNKNVDAQELNHINTLYLDKNSTLWLGTNAGLVRMFKASGNFSLYTHNKNAANTISGNKVTSIVEDQDGLLWVGTSKNGLNRFDPEKESFRHYKHDPSDNESLSVNSILTIFQDKSNILWIGTSLGGINKWNRAAEDLDVFRHNPYDPHSLSSSMVRSIYQDRQGTIWIGTVEGGLNKWSVDKSRFIHYQSDPNDPTSISNNHIRTMLEDSRGNFWIGTNGGGIDRMNRKTGEFKNYRHEPDNPKSLSNNFVWKITEDKNGNIWVATFGGGLCHFDVENEEFISYQYDSLNENSISDNRVTTIAEDHTNTLWVGTYGGGLNIFDRKTKEFTCFQYNENDPLSIGHDRIYSIMEDSDGTLWIGTKGSLNKHNRKTNDFKRFTEDNGLPNDVIMGILEDESGYLWISTNRGLSKFDSKNEEFRNYDVRDGLQSNEFLVNSYCKAKDSEMFFGGINGFNAFHPKNIKDNPHIPPIVITGFQIFNKEVKLDTSISEKKVINLSWRDHTFSFDFVALDYIFPEKNQYAYKMEGFDDEWNRVGTRRFASYTNLPPGEYTFKVIGSNNDEVWNKTGTEMKVIIHPAFWQTRIFKVTVVVVIALTILLIFRMRVRNIKRQKQELERLVKLRTAEVVSQKEEIEQQRDRIAFQKQEITDSIVYAKRIQKATLSSSAQVKGSISNYFVLLKPKDIVSGDFYWIGRQDNALIIAAADCTGHGVPGAFMSMLGISFLNKIVNEKKILEPTDILNRLRHNIIHSLRQKGIGDSSRDGMDMALITIDIENQVLKFAGANNPLYYIRDKKINIIKGDKMPIAIYDIMEPFTTHNIKIRKDDLFYIFSDGYADQFGGKKGKKFMYKRFRQLLVEISNYSMNEQKQILNSTIEEWKGENEQVDDILVIGVRI